MRSHLRLELRSNGILKPAAPAGYQPTADGWRRYQPQRDSVRFRQRNKTVGDSAIANSRPAADVGDDISRNAIASGSDIPTEPWAIAQRLMNQL